MNINAKYRSSKHSRVYIYVGACMIHRVTIDVRAQGGDDTIDETRGGQKTETKRSSQNDESMTAHTYTHTEVEPPSE